MTTEGANRCPRASVRGWRCGSPHAETSARRGGGLTRGWPPWAGPARAYAIDLETLKRHQDRIRAGLAEIDRKLDSGHEEHTGQRKHLATAIGLLARCAQTYWQSDDNGKRLANQAFFERIYIGEEDEQPDAVLAEPFAAVHTRRGDQQLISARNQAHDRAADILNEPGDPLILAHGAALFVWPEEAFAVVVNHVGGVVGTPHFGLPSDLVDVLAELGPVREARDVDEPRR